jgi:hypothetical protein
MGQDHLPGPEFAPQIEYEDLITLSRPSSTSVWLHFVEVV